MKLRPQDFTRTDDSTGAETLTHPDFPNYKIVVSGMEDSSEFNPLDFQEVVKVAAGMQLIDNATREEYWSEVESYLENNLPGGFGYVLYNDTIDCPFCDSEEGCVHCNESGEMDNPLCIDHIRDNGIADGNEMLEGLDYNPVDPEDAFFAVLPVYRFEHGNVALSTSGFSCPWDSGCAGMAWITPEGAKSLGLPDSAEGYGRASEIISYTVEEYGEWVNGEVYQWDLWEADTCDCCSHTEWEVVDSCTGYIGGDGREAAVSDAIESLSSVLSNLSSKENNQ